MNFKSIDSTYHIKYGFSGSDLLLGKNKLKLIASFEDHDGKRYAYESNFEIELQEKTLFGKFKAWLNYFDKRVDMSVITFADTVNEAIND